MNVGIRCLLIAVCESSCLLAAQCGDEDSGRLVADPFRAVGVVWPKHAIKGRDYWYLLSTPTFRIPGVKDEPFVREAGYFNEIFSTQTSGGSRVISIAGIHGADEHGSPVVLKAAVEVVNGPALVQSVESLVDEDHTTCCTITGSFLDPRTRYATLKAEFSISAESPMRTVVVEAGPSRGTRPVEVRAEGWTSVCNAENGDWTLTADKAVRSVRISVESQRYVFKTLGMCESARLNPHFREVPFTGYQLDRGILGLGPELVDLNEVNRIRKEYPETYLGTVFGEWDCTLLYRFGRPNSDRLREFACFGKIPCNRDEMRENFRMFWETARGQKGDEIIGFSGNANFELMAGEWGSKVSMLELTGEAPDRPFRNNIMYARGAARQFNTPLFFYMAFFRYSHSPDSRPEKWNTGAANEYLGPDWGQEISLGRRELYACYYSGGNYQGFEAMPWGQVRKNEKGVYELTQNGKSLKEFYDWYRSGRGVRGEIYAPILLLTDRAAGHDQMRPDRGDVNGGFGAYFGTFPPTDADFMTEYVLRSISPVVPTPWRQSPADRSSNFKNSTLADIFDVHVANSDVPGRELRLDQIEKYPVAVVLDDVLWNDSLANTVKRYVARGGTLVLTTAQAGPFKGDADFLGAKRCGTTREEDGFVVDDLVLEAGTKVAERTSGGRPFVIRRRFGDGAVVLVASPFFRRVTERTRVPVQVTHLLERLQAEVMPFAIRGRCHAMPTRLADGTWRVLVMNNAGVLKEPKDEQDTFFPEDAARVHFVLPMGAKVEEIRYGIKETNGGFTIPPGDLIIVDVKGIEARGKGATSAVCEDVLSFGEMPRVRTHEYDGYLHVPGVCSPIASTPEVLGRWLARDGYRDSSGQNHDMKIVGCRVSEDGLVCEGGKSGAFVDIRGTDYPMPEGRLDVWAAPGAADLIARGEMRCVLSRGDDHLCGPLFAVVVLDGHWQLAYGAWKQPYSYLKGPVATTSMTRLSVLFKDGFIRFFVNGREVIGTDGAFKYAGEIKDSFHNRCPFALGCRMNLQTGPRFSGVIGDLCFLSTGSSDERNEKNE